MLVACLVMPAMAQPAAMMQKLPTDPSVRIGKLPNGLTYYIRHNALPEKCANFYIAQKVGSVQEEESQRGLAHFLEHMCFNGSDHFPDNALIKYCESIGVKFGVNLNAYTSTDETVYNIDDVPVTESNIDSCLLILHDWADGLTLDPAEIDKERGVIHEEWRMRSSAQSRIFERNLPTLYPNSRYGHRYPIGLMSVVDNFKPAELRAYYEKWYRPDLQGIIVVGDIDVDQVEAKIKSIFSGIQMPKKAAKYEHYPVPDNAQPIYVIDKDKEQGRTILQLMFKHDPIIPDELKGSVIELMTKYSLSIAISAINSRLEEAAQAPDCPFIGAGCYDGHYIVAKTKDALSFGILPKPGKDKEALTAVIKEIKRVLEQGITLSEAQRASDEYINSLETIYNNRDKQKNDYYVPQYVRNFLESEAIPSIEKEYEVYKKLEEGFKKSNQMNQLANEILKEVLDLSGKNMVLLAMYPEKDDVTLPTQADFEQAVADGKNAQIEAYVDDVNNDPLVTDLPAKGSIEKEEAADFGYTCWTLSNGARVFFKKTDFNNSEVLFSAKSFGGMNASIEKDFVNTKLIEPVMGATGLGQFKSTELSKKLAGKQANCSVDLSTISEGLNGTSTPKDLRTLFELIYLRFQAPCNDVEAYNNEISYLRTQLENADKEPMKVYSDSLQSTLYDHNPLRRALKLADLDQANYETIKKLYSERYNAAGDFDFFFTGAIDVDSLRLFTEQYIAPLKGVAQRESYNDLKDQVVPGIHDNHFLRKMETPQAIIVQLWHGYRPYTLKESAIVNALGSILTQRYLKSIREDAGIAYSVNTDGEATFERREGYQLVTQCPVKPAQLDEALKLMKQSIDDIAAKGVTKDELSKVASYELKEYDNLQKENAFWLGLITAKVIWNKDLNTGCKEAIKSVTSDDIKAFVNDVMLKDNNCITVSMRPTDFTEKDGTK